MNIEIFTAENIVIQLGYKWNDTEIEYKLRNFPGFNNWEYLDRLQFFKLKVSEIKNHYPEYITSDSKCVLDISAGNGIQLEIMRLLGHRVLGIDRPNCSFSILARSQGIPIVEHDCSVLPIPVPSESYDLVTNVGALHHYTSQWDEVIREFMRIARETVFISITRGDNYEKNKDLLDNFENKGWSRVHHSPGKYKWVRDK